jgi:hypothetical protein
MAGNYLPSSRVRMVRLLEPVLLGGLLVLRAGFYTSGIQALL